MPIAASLPTGSITMPTSPNIEQLLLCDAQTSGGLLGAVPGDQAESVVGELRSVGATSAAVIGSIVAGEPGRIHVCRTTGAPAG